MRFRGSGGGTAIAFLDGMKRILVATIPLCACGSSGPHFPQCPNPPTTSFVDTTHFTDGGLAQQACTACSQPQCNAFQYDAGVAEVTCGVLCVGGRRPAEWVRADARARDVVGAWLANAAQLEAASVPAFEILADELRAHDAPPSLIARALAAADDERRHATIVSARARSFGAMPGPVRAVRSEPRDLERIARENAVEGLVREAYGALVEIDGAIAADERQHAMLARDVHAWIAPRLALAARRRVDEARELARESLLAECAVEPPAILRDVLGVPDATRAVDLALTL
jgi:hypothetical protein